LNLAQKYGKRAKGNAWIGLPFGASGGPLVYRKSVLQSIGYDKVPEDHAGILELYRKLQKAGKPAGFALGNAVGDANGFASWLLWSHNASLLDEEGNVIINSKETVAALKYLKELYPTFIPGTPSWNDVSNNRAYSAGEISLTANGVSLYFALKNDPATAAIAEDTEHQLLPKGLAATSPMGGPHLERHGVQAQPLSQCREGIPAVHDGEGAV
jgi:multiple sugar transport system substrate-binding protein